MDFRLARGVYAVSVLPLGKSRRKQRIQTSSKAVEITWAHFKTSAAE